MTDFQIDGLSGEGAFTFTDVRIDRLTDLRIDGFADMFIVGLTH